jgi:hypothetical protein
MTPHHGFPHFAVWWLVLLGLAVSSCAEAPPPPPMFKERPVSAKDKKPSVWTSQHPRVVELRSEYILKDSADRTVTKTLARGRPYLPTIFSIFDKLDLPRELAYLPMLESSFDPSAETTISRGLWQFTAVTGRSLGLFVSDDYDERLDWRKSTEAAARYLDKLGQRFAYNWGLALASYNGGPTYVAREVRRQGKDDVYLLDLHGETADYVPRFVALLQVLKLKSQFDER